MSDVYHYSNNFWRGYNDAVTKRPLENLRNEPYAKGWQTGHQELKRLGFPPIPPEAWGPTAGPHSYQLCRPGDILPLKWKPDIGPFRT